MENVLASKNDLVSRLELELSDARQVCFFCSQVHDSDALFHQSYYQMIRAYEGKLEEFGIPVSELGFQPARLI